MHVYYQVGEWITVFLRQPKYKNRNRSIKNVSTSGEKGGGEVRIRKPIITSAKGSKGHHSLIYASFYSNFPHCYYY